LFGDPAEGAAVLLLVDDAALAGWADWAVLAAPVGVEAGVGPGPLGSKLLAICFLIDILAPAPPAGAASSLRRLASGLGRPVDATRFRDSSSLTSALAAVGVVAAGGWAAAFISICSGDSRIASARLCDDGVWGELV